MIKIPEAFESLPLPEGFVLERDKQGRLSLFDTRDGAPGPLCVDFLSGKTGWRVRDLARGDLLPRAVGMKSKQPPRTLLDATAGLGFDAASLALMGLDVTAIEQSPIVHALLMDGLNRAITLGGEGFTRLKSNLKVICADSRHFLRMHAGERSSILDVIYLDPMFPEAGKRARSRKEMQHLQAILPPQPALELQELFQLAMGVAARRVVVKRPLHAPEIAENPPPSHCLKGKSVRFDVYIVTRGNRDTDPAV